MSDATGKAVEHANSVVDSAQSLLNEVVDVPKAALGEVLSAVVTANKLLGNALEEVAKALNG